MSQALFSPLSLICASFPHRPCSLSQLLTSSSRHAQFFAVITCFFLFFQIALAPLFGIFSPEFFKTSFLEFFFNNMGLFCDWAPTRPPFYFHVVRNFISSPRMVVAVNDKSLPFQNSSISPSPVCDTQGFRMFSHSVLASCQIRQPFPHPGRFGFPLSTWTFFKR